jgi:BRCA1-associated protein 2
MVSDIITGPVEATFVPHARNKSGTTNLPEGTVHVFRDGSSKPSPEELEAKVSEMSISDLDPDGVMLGVLAVPSWMTPSDFLAFVAPAVEGIGHLRIIRYVETIAALRNLSDLRLFRQRFRTKSFIGCLEVL